MDQLTDTAQEQMCASKDSCRICGASTKSCRILGYRQCESCQLLQVPQLPSSSDLEHYYSEEFAVNRSYYLDVVARRGRRDLNWLESLVSPGRILEIGCSWGKFLDIARARGWEVAGVELSNHSSKWARTELKLDVFTGKLEDSRFVGSGNFDLVVAWHVIEHMREPLGFLQACRSCLKPGGYLVLKTPNAASFSCRFNGRAWSWADPASHPFLLSPQTLAVALPRTGFELKRVFTRRGDGHNLWLEIVRGIAIRAGVHSSIKGTLGVDSSSGNGHGDPDRRPRLLSQLNRAFDAGLFFLWPLEEILNRLDRGPELRVVAAAR